MHRPRGTAYALHQQSLQRGRCTTCLDVKHMLRFGLLLPGVYPFEVREVVNVTLRTTNDEPGRDKSSFACLAPYLFKNRPVFLQKIAICTRVPKGETDHRNVLFLLLGRRQYKSAHTQPSCKSLLH